MDKSEEEMLTLIFKKTKSGMAYLESTQIGDEETKIDPKKLEEISGDKIGDFEVAISDFRSSLESFRKSSLVASGVMQVMGSAASNTYLLPDVRRLSSKDIIHEDSEIYEVPLGKCREIFSHIREIKKYDLFGSMLPRMLIIGLVGIYDGFIENIIEACLRNRPELIKDSEKTMSFSSLLNFNSIDDAKDFVLRQEVDAVIRDSHQNHFNWFRKKLDLKIEIDAPIWQNFVEICERRNLFTHTNGRVNEQYLANCRHNKMCMESTWEIDFRSLPSITAMRLMYSSKLE